MHHLQAGIARAPTWRRQVPAVQERTGGATASLVGLLCQVLLPGLRRPAALVLAPSTHCHPCPWVSSIGHCLHRTWWCSPRCQSRSVPLLARATHGIKRAWHGELHGPAAWVCPGSRRAAEVRDACRWAALAAAPLQGPPDLLGDLGNTLRDTHAHGSSGGLFSTQGDLKQLGACSDICASTRPSVVLTLRRPFAW